MHRDRGVSAAAVPGDRKRIGEPMDRSSPSTSWGFSGGREKERIVAGKLPEMPRSGGGSTAMSKSKLTVLSDGGRCFHYAFIILWVTLFALLVNFLGLLEVDLYAFLIIVSRNVNNGVNNC